MINYNVMNWKSIKRYETTVVILDVDSPDITIELKVSEEERRELLVVDKYISYSTDLTDSESPIRIYNIKSRAFDVKGNLILFTKNEIIR